MESPCPGLVFLLKEPLLYYLLLFDKALLLGEKYSEGGLVCQLSKLPQDMERDRRIEDNKCFVGS